MSRGALGDRDTGWFRSRDGADADNRPLARWRAAVGLALLVALLSVANALAEPDRFRFHAGVVVAWTSATALFLGAAVLLYLRWRVSREAEVGWLAVTALWAALYVLSFTVRLYVDPGSRHLVDSNILGVLTAVVALVFFMNLRAGRPLPARSPTLLGAGCLGVSAGLQVMLYFHEPLLPDTHSVGIVTDLIVAVVALMCAATLASTRQVDRAVRRQLVLVCVLCAASRLVVPVGVSQPSPGAVLAPFLSTLAAAVLAREALFLLGRARQVAAAEAIIRDRDEHRDAEDLHELRASLSGVAKAIQLLAGFDAAFTEERRQRLTKVLASEVNRLERLLARTAPGARAELFVDDILEPVVFARRMDGQDIEWEPCGHRVVGVADGIVEAVNILLVNAANHAPASPVRISATREPDRIRLRIADQGPGVPREVRQQLFTDGVRGDGSHGQGIGLGLARRLLLAQGAGIELVDPAPQGGAVFDLLLPAPARGVTVEGRPA